MTEPTTDWRTALEQIARTDTLLVALDFDGTLAPLQDDPMQSRALPESAAAIARLADLPATIVAYVSGRSLPDLRIIGEHDDASKVWLAGSHGVEYWRPADAVVTELDEPDETHERELLERLNAEAKQLVDGFEGAWIEDKSVGFALHTRLTPPDIAPGIQGVIDALVAREAPGWRRRPGHNLIEYSWRHEGKDAAVARLREQTGASAVLFAGDDVTDEDALGSLQEHDLGVRVGPGETSARVRVADAHEFAELLSALADLRAS
ncbi:trehalose-phosphatase [Microbacterium sediminis]|uniref:trehalose-phosphatase n=1 Tax=Microbacterium sediminis TaxID=904291 RepID=UPI00107261A7|nr:trehalose-phosphatase [Microbacterium sediminis]QBR73985.1 trehalose-phosphatase [Microbacterium sediminis]